MLSRAKAAISNPSNIAPYLRFRRDQFLWHLSNGNLLGALFVLLDTIGIADGQKLYFDYLKNFREDTVSVEIFDTQIRLDPRIHGIDEGLIWKGETREYISSKEYGKMLSELGQLDENIVVFDIGSNIGFFVLLAMNRLPDIDIWAFEPNRSNYNRLKINTRTKSKNVTTINKAIGRDETTGNLIIDEQSTLHRISDYVSRPQDIKSESVDVVSLDGFIREQGIDFDTCIVRIDIQGHEFDAFLGMRDLLESNHSIFLFIEVHFNMISESEFAQMKNMLFDNGFEIHHVGGRSGLSTMDVTSFQELEDLGSSIHLQVKKNITTSD